MNFLAILARDRETCRLLAEDIELLAAGGVTAETQHMTPARRRQHCADLIRMYGATIDKALGERRVSRRAMKGKE